MTLKHSIYFFIWKAYAYLIGIRKGIFVKCYSDEKNKTIQGVITQINGNSVSDNKWSEDIQIQWFEPMQGNDSRFYSSGGYFHKDFKDKILFK